MWACAVHLCTLLLPLSAQAQKQNSSRTIINLNSCICCRCLLHACAYQSMCTCLMISAVFVHFRSPTPCRLLVITYTWPDGTENNDSELGMCPRAPTPVYIHHCILYIVLSVHYREKDWQGNIYRSTRLFWNQHLAALYVWVWIQSQTLSLSS